MCNNWLQYAHVYAWGLEHGIKTISMRFSYKYKYFRISDSESHNWLTYIYAKFLIKSHIIKCLCIQEPYMVTENVISLLKHRRLIAIDGWQFRHRELFIKYRNDIRNLFTFVPKTIAKKKQWLENLPAADIRLGIHIRRGDYATWNDGAFYFSDEVYADIIRKFCELYKEQKIQVFIATNDPKTDFKKLRDISGINDIYPINGNPGEDLFVLSECDYIIGPKSTFSLVAAFYHDIPLYWIENKDCCITKEKFCHFTDLFMYV